MASATNQSMSARLKEKILDMCRKEVKYKNNLHVTGMLSLTPDNNEKEEIIVKITETVSTTSGIDFTHQSNFSSLLDYFERLSKNEESPPQSFSVSNNSAFQRVETKESDDKPAVSVNSQHTLTKPAHDKVEVDQVESTASATDSAHMLSPPFLTNMVLNLGKSVVTPTLVSRSTEPVSPVARFVKCEAEKALSPVESLICLARQHPQLAQVMKDRLKSGQFSPQVIKLFAEAKRKLVGTDHAKKHVTFDDSHTDTPVKDKPDENPAWRQVKPDKKHTPDLIRVLQEQKRRLQEGKPRSQVLGITRQKHLSFEQQEVVHHEAEAGEEGGITKSRQLSFDQAEKRAGLEEGLFAKAMHEIEEKAHEAEALERALRKERRKQSLGKKLMLKRAKLAEKERLRVNRSNNELQQNKLSDEVQSEPKSLSDHSENVKVDNAIGGDEVQDKSASLVSKLDKDIVLQTSVKVPESLVCKDSPDSEIVEDSSVRVKEEKVECEEDLYVVNVPNKELIQSDDLSFKTELCEVESVEVKEEIEENGSVVTTVERGVPDVIEVKDECDSPRKHLASVENESVVTIVELGVPGVIEVKDEESQTVEPNFVEVKEEIPEKTDTECKESDAATDTLNDDSVECMNGKSMDRSDVSNKASPADKSSAKTSTPANANKVKLDDSGLNGITLIGVAGSDRLVCEEPPDILDCSWTSDSDRAESFIPDVNFRYMEEESRDSVLDTEAPRPFDKYQHESPASSPGSLFSEPDPDNVPDTRPPALVLDGATDPEASMGFSPFKKMVQDRGLGQGGIAVVESKPQGNDTKTVVDLKDRRVDRKKEEVGENVLERQLVDGFAKPMSPAMCEKNMDVKSVDVNVSVTGQTILNETVGVKDCKEETHGRKHVKCAHKKSVKHKRKKTFDKESDFQSKLPRLVAVQNDKNASHKNPQNVAVADSQVKIDFLKDPELNKASELPVILNMPSSKDPDIKSPPSRRKNSNPMKYEEIKKKKKEKKCKKCGVIKICKKCNSATKHKTGDKKCKTACPKCGGARKKALETTPKRPPSAMKETVCCKKKGYKTPNKKVKRKKQTPPSSVTRPIQPSDTPHHALPTFSSLQKATPAQRSRMMALQGLNLPRFDLTSPQVEDRRVSGLTSKAGNGLQNKIQSSAANVTCGHVSASKCETVLVETLHTKSAGVKPKEVGLNKKPVTHENMVNGYKGMVGNVISTSMSKTENGSGYVENEQRKRSISKRPVLGSLAENSQISMDNRTTLQKETTIPSTQVPKKSNTSVKSTLQPFSINTSENIPSITRPKPINVTPKPIIQVSPSSGSHLLVLPPPVYQHELNHALPKYNHQTDYPCCNIIVKKCQAKKSPPKLPNDGAYVNFVKDTKISIRNSRPGKRKKNETQNEGPGSKVGRYQQSNEGIPDSVSPVGKGRCGRRRGDSFIQENSDGFKLKQKWIEAYKPAETP